MIPFIHKPYNIFRQSGRSLILSSVGSVARISNSVHIINGHTLSDRRKTTYDCSDAEHFERILKVLSRSCDFVSLQEAVKLIENRVTIKRPKIAFTYDDGFDECYYFIAPILEKFGVRGTFFINPNFATAGSDNDKEYIQNFVSASVTNSAGRKPMTWAQIKELSSRGHLIGAHTMNHIRLNGVNSEQLRREIIDCKDVIEKQLSQSCEHFAWPFGKLSDISDEMINIACATYQYVYSQSDHVNYYSFNGRVLNRRHCEPWWPLSHIKFFLKDKRKFPSDANSATN